MNEREVQSGLTQAEADRRLKKYGPNLLEKKKKISPLTIFLSQFNDFITWVLIGATIISGFMGEKADAVTIIIIIVMNSVLGFIQEFKTEKSLEALKNMASPTSKVIRNGKLKIVNAQDLVIGDLIVIESGDKIPADCMITESSNLMIDESLLTGESAGVSKSIQKKENSIYMGTIVLTGNAKAKVTGTGMETEMGKIAGMLQSIEKDTSPLKEKLNNLGKILVVLCLIVCAVVTIAGIMRGENKYEMFLLGVSLAVAAIPESLTAIVTVALALGVSRMLKRNALIRKLPAVETLGCTSIICSDKTGTLTENKMTVKAMYSNGRTYNLDRESVPENAMLKKIFTYCNDCNVDTDKKNISESLIGDPTETALIKVYFRDGKTLKNFLGRARRVYDIPFDSDRKMMSVIVKEGSKEISYVKGAPEKLIRKCKYILDRGNVRILTSNERNNIVKAIENMSFNALRCIAGAYKEKNLTRGKSLEDNLIFVGIAGIIDPPRKEVKDAVLKCKMAGIKPVMITGDHKNTAFAIGYDLGICKTQDQVITGDDLDKLTDKQLEKTVDKKVIFARVTPKHKLRIVRAFKSKNKVVAMTGDGVNDAPAVKEADIGICMGISGTDVTKEAASMVLLDDNFTTIVSAVEEGRVIYDNIRKFIRYLLSCNLGEVLTMFLASAFNLAIPLLPIQILMVNLATDGLPAIALGVDPPEGDIMAEKPRIKNESIFARGLTEKILVRGALIGTCTIFSFVVAQYLGFGLKTARTMALATLVMSQLIHVFECRSENHSIFQINLFSNKYLLGAIAASICMILAIVYIPFLQNVFHTSAMNLIQWGIVIFFSGIIALINSLYLYFK
ncbi:MAG: calcium-translocating P-type ATPase, PMCA-type [Clostridium tyrobutyricum]|uniref:calcium-translocating P-type ATPase, PMCA-type n=1 Tax=Clostridium tyrobutyricum TaxID=1519 RepID=UPI00164E50DB|nr:calcium-translocating P-type ATPase, PMCA-type [Clostridium tyrobutyricum]MBR9646874.1 calcium-translocating P-type ATPase, PMCA-type [Clostridium tyrobutyricum]MBV4415261.1 calcium-translocating P-type ATPase, PMCA-type [Clostridium tyrobutyricum]MBV4420932.1 calcium-translocating P-type ATPase, PMCA-type [Clostridium tyrobutyricum]MBV4424041.1 calcium-translocating P-type ATPase, PMCA-type [Clostridium tyrobutyricum]MBV4435894.1 calcium-translocating P-type ATPase, PMCA-type [Clostridium 